MFELGFLCENSDAAAPDSLLEAETFTTVTAYDALNRAISIKTPHNSSIPASEILPAYNEANLLERVDVKLRGSSTATNFVQNIDYDAKGQRERIRYGNESTTGYAYDDKTFRLKRLLTTRNNGADILQDLNYTYDAAGNVTQIDDNSQQTVFFNGTVVSPNQKFEYDALYRLVKATGREHVSVNADSEPEAEGYNAAQISPQDGTAMRNYAREWEYDSVGNILSIIHDANGNAWTRTNTYAQNSNRLVGTGVGQTAASFAYNAHGSMTSMPHLSAMDWDFAEKLCRITRGTTEAYYDYDGSGIRTRKVVEKNGIVETRLYLGGFEIWRKTVNGVLDTERETLHVMDDKRRIALVETLTVENGNRVAGPAAVQRYQLDNHLGSASLELDESANIISYEEYYPYGDTSYRAGRNASEVSRKRYRYTGKEKDEESGLYYHGARYYACWLGRWTAADPIGIGDGLNVYMYVQGNPVSGVDPSGMGTEDYDEAKVNEESSPKSNGKQIKSENLSNEKKIGFNCGKNYKDAVNELTDIIETMIKEKDLTLQQLSLVANIPDAKIFLTLAKDAYLKGKDYLSDKRNRPQLESLNKLRIKTKNDPQKNEFYFTGFAGKKENLEPKKGVISGGQKFVEPQYDINDTHLFHSHPDENPLSFNGQFIKIGSKEYIDGRAGDLGAASDGKKNIFAITPNGDIYFTTPDLAHFGMELSAKSSFYGTGKFGQVYLGNIREYRGRKK